MLDIARCVIDIIQRSVADAAPHEACGLLFGSSGRIDAARPCRNVAAQPEITFEIDPAALIAAYRAERAGGPRLVGCYHSHPSGGAMPSARDAAAAAANDWVWIIVGGGEVRAYRAVEQGAIHGRFDPAAIAISAI